MKIKKGVVKTKKLKFRHQRNMKTLNFIKKLNKMV